MESVTHDELFEALVATYARGKRQKGEFTAAEFGNRTGLSASSARQHLRQLVKTGTVTSRNGSNENGVNVAYYKVVPPKPKKKKRVRSR